MNERGWHRERVSASYGLMQILFVVANERGFRGEPEDLYIPEVNLHWGCRQLSWLYRRLEGDRRKVVAAYNGGLGAAEAVDDTGLLRNQMYVDKVWNYYVELFQRATGRAPDTEDAYRDLLAEVRTTGGE